MTKGNYLCVPNPLPGMPRRDLDNFRNHALRTDSEESYLAQLFIDFFFLVHVSTNLLNCVCTIMPPKVLWCWSGTSTPRVFAFVRCMPSILGMHSGLLDLHWSSWWNTCIYMVVMKLLCQNNTKLLGWTSMHGAVQKGYSTLVPIWLFVFSADPLTVWFAFSQFLQLRHSQYVFSQKATISVQGGHAELHAKA